MTDMEINTFTITLKHPPQEVRPNARVHWATKAKHVKLCRSSAFWVCKKALQNTGFQFMPSSYGITWYFFGQVPDADNCLSSCKAYLDGCCDAFKIDDKTLVLTHINRLRDKEKKGKIEIQFCS